MIKIGDIVKTKSKNGKSTLPAVVTRVNTYQKYNHSEVELESIDILFADGTYGWRSANKFTETGRHIDMENVLESIKR